MMEFAQLRDQVKVESLSRRPIGSSGLIGTWLNSNLNTNGIARVEISESGDELWLQVYAMGPDGLIDWGKAPVAPFTSSASSEAAAGLTCRFDFGFAETSLQGMIMKGLLVLTQFHRFKDDSKRIDYFAREYFALDHGRF